MKKLNCLLVLIMGMISLASAQTSNTLYGIVRKNYFTNQNFDSCTIRMGSANTLNGIVTNIGSNAYKMGINLTGAALNPYDSTYIFISSDNEINTLSLSNGQLINQVAINNPIASSYFDNFRFCHGDSTMYGLARRNYFDSTLNMIVGQLYLAKINTTTGTITQISPNSLGQGYALAGSAIDPYQMVYYYSTGSNLVGVDMYTGLIYTNTAIQLPANSHFDNFTYSCIDTALYGLVRTNYFNSVNPFLLDSSTVRLGKINPTTGSNLIGVDMYTGLIYTNSAIQLPANNYFDNFTYSCIDTALYGLVRTNYFNNVNPNLLDSSTVRLGKINPTTGVVTILSTSSLYGIGYSLNAGSAIDPNNMTFYYSIGSHLVGASLFNGQLNSVDSLTFANGDYFDLMRNFDNCRTISIIRNNTSTGISETGESTISIAPNPANEFINIQSKDLISTLEIYNLQGQLMMSEKYAASTIQVSTQGLTNGIYILKVKTNDNEIYKKKLIKN